MTHAAFAAAGSPAPPISLEYQPGVCNIGPAEIARRQAGRPLRSRRHGRAVRDPRRDRRAAVGATAPRPPGGYRRVRISPGVPEVLRGLRRQGRRQLRRCRHDRQGRGRGRTRARPGEGEPDQHRQLRDRGCRRRCRRAAPDLVVERAGERPLRSFESLPPVPPGERQATGEASEPSTENAAFTSELFRYRMMMNGRIDMPSPTTGARVFEEVQECLEHASPAGHDHGEHPGPRPE